MVLKKGHEYEERSLTSVKRVIMQDFGELTIQFGQKERLVIEADDRMLPHVFSKVNEGILFLSLDRAWQEKLSNSFTLRALRYSLILKSLDALEVSGLARVNVGAVIGEAFYLRQTGRTTTHIESIQTARFDGVLHWGSRLTIAGGSARMQKVVLSHSSKYTADHLHSEEAELELSADSAAAIWVSRSLTAWVGEGCSLEYCGDPSVQVSGSGTVSRREAG